jgi:uncharacterized membrane protein
MPAHPLDRAVADGYPLDLRTLLEDAARHLRGSKRVLLAGALLWLAISTAVAWLTALLGLAPEPSAALGVLATAPLTVAIVMAGARRASGAPITYADLGRHRGATAQAAIVLLANLIVVLGGEALLGTIAAAPLTIGYGLFTSLALYLVADRGFDALRAIRTSALLVRHRWGTLLLLQLALALLLALAILPFGLGLIWAGPFAVVAGGAVYVRAVGLAEG